MLSKALPICLFFCVTLISSPAQSVIESISGWDIKQESGVATLSPAAGSTEGSFRYIIQNPVIVTMPINSNWFKDAVAADIQQQKYTETQKSDIKKAYAINIYVSEITDAATQKWYVAYFGYVYSNNKIRIGKAIGLNQKDFEQNTPKVVTHFSQLAKKEGAQDIVGAASPKIVTGDKPVAGKKNNLDAITILNGGLKDADIYTVIFHLEYEYGVGGAVYPVHNPYILLKDGSIYKEPVISPYDLNTTASRQAEPRKWGTWKMNGTQLTSFWPAETNKKYQEKVWEAKSYFKISGAKKDETLKGSFKTITGSGNTALGGDIMIVSAANITFNNSGQFTLAKAAGISGQGPWNTQTSKSNESGTYTLRNYMIEFKYNDGTIQRRFFYFFPDSRDHFGIGSSAYIPAK